ncbi:MAG: hypothetical protein ACPGNT_05025 [Rhodospirillales bacterium]
MTKLLRFRELPLSAAIVLGLGLTGCQSTGTPSVLGLSDTSEAETSALDQCDSLFANDALAPLRGVIPVGPRDLPTKAMLADNTVPGKEQIAALQILEAAERTCKDVKAEAGIETSAMEDIVGVRLSKLRYGLYQGEIPFAVYNYGVAKALKEKAQFSVEAEEAYARGEEVGAQKAAQFASTMNQIQMQNQLNTIQSQYNYYNTMNSFKTWNCTASSFGYNMASISCR